MFGVPVDSRIYLSTRKVDEIPTTLKPIFQFLKDCGLKPAGVFPVGSQDDDVEIYIGRPHEK
jgi:hypothetical protein